MMKSTKRWIAWLLCTVLLIGAMPFAAVAAAEIGTVELTLPEAEGETLNLAAIEVPAGAEYEVESFYEFLINGTEVSGNEVVLADEDHVRVTVWVQTTGTATFADELAITVNGNTATGTNAPISIKVYYEFYVGGGSGVVDAVEIALPEAPGETIDLAAITVPTGAAYKVRSIDSFTVNGYNPSGALERGDKVYIRLWIDARGTATFDEAVTATVNGNPATISVLSTDAFKVTYEFTACELIDEVELTYDPDVIRLNTAFTEGEVDVRIRDNIAVATNGVQNNGGNSGLRIKQEDEDFWGINDGSAMVDAAKNYAIRYTLELDAGYDWVKTAKNTSEVTGLTVKINGTDVTDAVIFEYNDYWNWMLVYYVIGNADTTPIVTDITMSETVLSLEKGSEHTFSGEVKGTVADKTIVWTVEGAVSADTAIDSTGKLTIGADETAETLTVKATANADNTRFATAEITVTEELPYIDDVQIYPTVDELYTGAEKTYTVTVGGTQTDKSVTWSVEGATSANTVIAADGTLTIGTDETAETITVKAVANRDHTKFCTVTVTVKQKTRISEINLTFDMAEIKLHTTLTEGTVNANVKNNIGHTTDGIELDLGNSHLMYKPEGNEGFHGIEDGSAKVDGNKNYYIAYLITVTGANDWVETAKNNSLTGLAVKINGAERTDLEFSYNEHWNDIKVYVPIGKATCPHEFGEYVYNNDATLESDGTKTRSCGFCGHPETVTAVGTRLNPTNPFVDVKSTDYFYNPVRWAVSKGITTGVSANQFGPTVKCERSQVVTFLWRAAGKPEPESATNPFTDVKSTDYFYKAVLWAVEEGITTGTSATTFSPFAVCERGQIVTFLWRAAGKPEPESATNPFTDVKATDYYYKAVLWAVEEGITTGTGATTFSPTAICERCQVVTFLYRYNF